MATGGEQKRHILLQFEGQAESYTSPRSGRNDHTVPYRERRRHAEELLNELDKAVKAKEDSWSMCVSGVSGPDGIVLGFRSAIGHSLKADSLEMRKSGIRLLNVKKTRNGAESAAVYVPHGKVELFIRKLKAYRDEVTPKKGNPKNQALVESISSIEFKVLETLWTDEVAMPESALPYRFELWLWRESTDDSVWDSFLQLASGLGISYSDRVTFPERDVVEVIASLDRLASDSRFLNCLAEIKFAREIESLFQRAPLVEQADWVRDLRARTQMEAGETRVCLLDTGVNNGHPLLKLLFEDESLHTYNPRWGTADRHGHGTEMAGLVAYGDLTEAFSSEERVSIKYTLESVKVTEPTMDENAGSQAPSGHVTTESVNRVESTDPFRNRVYCLTVSEKPSERIGFPTTWSATIDQLSAGLEDEECRLFIVAAGNTSRDSHAKYPQNLREAVHSPGQSWNALTVGAFTRKTKVNQELSGADHWIPLAPSGGLSPSSCTSYEWDSAWPYKPDVVFEGGNSARNKQNATVDFIDGLNLLTTSRNLFQPLVSSGDTSAATALASGFAAKIWADYPELWPETVRGLMVHAASWTDAMERLVGGTDTKSRVKKLLRLAGYGVPDIDTALWSASNSLTLLIEDDLQPYCKSQDGKRIVTNELNLHALPWPKEVLEELGSTEVEMRVTLSYFVEPSPGQRGWTVKHRYASHGLRFEVKLPTESIAEFKERINKEERDEELEEDKSYPGDSDEWRLGQQLRPKGSVCSDVWHGIASDLAARETIAVFPVTGWWKERKHLGRWDSEARYSLIVTIRTPEVETDIYTPVLNQVEISV